MFRLAAAPGIEMRQFRAADADPVFAVVERNRDYLRQWLPWVDRTSSAEDIGEFISSVASQYDAGMGPNTAIWVDGAIAGSIGVHPIDWANRSCSIGYWIESAQQGKGIITQCCATLLNYLFDDLLLHRVEIRCGTGNARSCAVPQRLGFTCERVAREAEWVNDRWLDLMVWSMLEQDWRRQYQPAG
jgi:ribosomal-protein-serine acetyltransferase